MSQSFGQPPAPPQTRPEAVPYVEFHTGPKRFLTLHLVKDTIAISGTIPPIVSIDGRQYIVYWGTVTFEIPVDRPCHLSVHIEGGSIGQAASALLPAGPAPVVLTYRVSATGVAKLDPAG